MSRRHVTFAVLLALVAWGATVTAPGPVAAQESFVLLVHTSNPVDQMSVDDVADYFLKRSSRWSHGESVEPVDQTAASAVRIAFSRRVFAKEVPWIKGFWQKQIFSGRATPPPELATDAEIVAFVARTPGGLGYVRSGTRLSPEVKTVRLVGGG